MVTFTIPTANPIFNNVGLGMLIGGLALVGIGLVIFLIGRLRERVSNRKPEDVESADGMKFIKDSSGKSYVPIFIVALIMLAVGAPFTILHTTNTVITIENGSFSVAGKYFPAKNYTSGEVKYAFVENIHTGNITITHKDYGTNSATVKEGKFSLSNGATAYVASVNSTDLVVELTSGPYIILGLSNMSSLESAFSGNIYQLPGSQ